MPIAAIALLPTNLLSLHLTFFFFCARGDNGVHMWSSLLNLQQLQSLEWTTNDWCPIPASIYRLTALTCLLISICKDDHHLVDIELPATLGQLLNLRQLRVQGGLRIEEVPAAFSSLTNLTSLELPSLHCGVNHWEVMMAMSNLEELVLHATPLPVHPMIHVRTAELSLSQREGVSVPISRLCRAFPGLESLILVRSNVRVQSDDIDVDDGACDMWSHLTSLKLKGCARVSTWSMLNAGLLH
jgi:hypothetical protein